MFVGLEPLHDFERLCGRDFLSPARRFRAFKRFQDAFIPYAETFRSGLFKRSVRRPERQPQLARKNCAKSPIHRSHNRWFTVRARVEAAECINKFKRRQT